MGTGLLMGMGCLWGVDENILEFGVNGDVCSQPCECAETHRITHFEGVDVVKCELNLNKKKRINSDIEVPSDPTTQGQPSSCC